MVYLLRHGQTDWNLFKRFNGCTDDMIMEEYKEKNAMIITHAANVRVIDYYFKGKPKNYDFSNRVIEKGELIIYDNSKMI